MAERKNDEVRKFPYVFSIEGDELTTHLVEIADKVMTSPHRNVMEIS
jgi:hypothetical protein